MDHLCGIGARKHVANVFCFEVCANLYKEKEGKCYKGVRKMMENSIANLSSHPFSQQTN